MIADWSVKTYVNLYKVCTLTHYNVLYQPRQRIRIEDFQIWSSSMDGYCFL